VARLGLVLGLVFFFLVDFWPTSNLDGKMGAFSQVMWLERERERVEVAKGGERERETCMYQKLGMVCCFSHFGALKRGKKFCMTPFCMLMDNGVQDFTSMGIRFYF
jgi:hypothetical protein